MRRCEPLTLYWQPIQPRGWRLDISDMPDQRRADIPTPSKAMPKSDHQLTERSVLRRCSLHREPLWHSLDQTTRRISVGFSLCWTGRVRVMVQFGPRKRTEPCSCRGPGETQQMKQLPILRGHQHDASWGNVAEIAPGWDHLANRKPGLTAFTSVRSS
jgi:hypothetical protein